MDGSRNPVAAYTHRTGFRMGQVEFKDFLWEALMDVSANVTMGDTAETLADRVLVAEHQLYPATLGTYVSRHQDAGWIEAQPIPSPHHRLQRLEAAAKTGLLGAISIKEKLERYKKLDEVKKTVITEALLEDPEREKEIKSAFDDLKKSYIRDNRDVVIRFMKAYLEGIYVFKTNKEVALNVLKKYTRLDDLSLVQVAYDEMSQRLIRRVPYPDREGIQTIIDQLAKTRPQMKNLNPSDFIDPTILKEIDDSAGERLSALNAEMRTEHAIVSANCR